MWTVSEVFIECGTILFLLYVLVFLATSHVGLNSPTRDRTFIPCIGKQSLIHRTTRKAPLTSFKLLKGQGQMLHVFGHMGLSMLCLKKNFFFCFSLLYTMEKEMATHSSVLAWRIPWTEEPGGLLSMGSHRVRHDWSNLALYIKGLPKWLSG